MKKGATVAVRSPQSLTGGRQMFLVDVMVHREHLPGGVLNGVVFPILHHPQTANVWIVPARYWPDELVSWWDDAE